MVNPPNTGSSPLRYAPGMLRDGPRKSRGRQPAAPSASLRGRFAALLADRRVLPETALKWSESRGPAAAAKPIRWVLV